MYLFLFIGLAWRMSDTVKVGPDVSCGETNVKCVSCSHAKMSTNELMVFTHRLHAHALRYHEYSESNKYYYVQCTNKLHSLRK